MKRMIPIALSMSLVAAAALAEDVSEPSPLERGMQLFMEGILKEMEPAIEEFEGFAEEMAPALRQFADEMGPKLSDILSEIEDWSAYQAPEVLPNGDIIIRRKPEPPLSTPDTPGDLAPQIEL